MELGNWGRGRLGFRKAQLSAKSKKLLYQYNICPERPRQGKRLETNGVAFIEYNIKAIGEWSPRILVELRPAATWRELGAGGKI